MLILEALLREADSKKNINKKDSNLNYIGASVAQW